MEQQEAVNSEEQSKVRKRFENALSNFALILGGKSLFKATKLVPKQVQDAVKELAAEEVTKAVEEFKTKARQLIQDKREHDKHVANMKKEFEKKEEESMKKFVERATDLERMIENIQGIEKGYYDTFLGISNEQGKKDEG